METYKLHFKCQNCGQVIDFETKKGVDNCLCDVCGTWFILVMNNDYGKGNIYLGKIYEVYVGKFQEVLKMY